MTAVTVYKPITEGAEYSLYFAPKVGSDKRLLRQQLVNRFVASQLDHDATNNKLQATGQLVCTS